MLEVAMTKSSTLNIRIKDELKADAAEVLARYGITLSDAVRIFLTSVATKKSLPAELVMDDDAYDAWLSKKLESSLKNRGSSRNAKDFLKNLE
jgi:DNA-damage-inducible protein J